VKLTRMQIRNFQCYEDRRLQFDPMITAIIGPSDSGKSTIMRALKWVATNRPRGSGFVRMGSKEVTVSVWLDDSKVTRHKGKENSYGVVTNGQEQKCKAIGTDVPETVSSVLSMDEANFQGQHEAPFWLSLTGSEVTHRLNEIVDLESIDLVVERLSVDHRQAQVDVRQCEKVVSERTEALKELDFVSSVDKGLRRLEVLSDQWQGKQRLAGGLSSGIELWLSLQERQELAKKVWLASRLLESRAESYREVQQRCGQLEELIRRTVELSDNSTIELPDLDKLEGMVKKKRGKEKSVERLVELVTMMSRRQEEVMKHSKRLDESVEELGRLEGICPLCGNEIRHKES